MKNNKKPAQLACIKHPTYNGTTPPDLACQNCCFIFVTILRSNQTLTYRVDEKKENSDK